MTADTASEYPSSGHPVLLCADVGRVRYRSADRELFDRLLRDFVPPRVFDVHAHLYDLRHLVPPSAAAEFVGSPEVNHDQYQASLRQWMGDRTPRAGLFFPFPVKDLDCRAANKFLAEALRNRDDCCGLMMIRPQDDPTDAEAELLRCGFRGFKVYHVFADRADTFFAKQNEFLPEWAWELADRHSLTIMMHMVLPRALSDPGNSSYIIEHCRRFPGAKLVLAHAARGFNAGHTVAAIDSLRGLDNVWFDTSAVCEPAAFEAILAVTGITRLMYGSDFPVSEMRGRSLSVGDGFFWLYENNARWDNWKHGSAELVGLESLLALRQACRTMRLTDSDVERLFDTNARQMLNIHSAETTSAAASRGRELYREAKTLIPGGTQLLSKRPEMFAPEQWPAYYEQAIGCEVIDADGRRYIDMSHCGILSCILGFSDPDVNAAVIRRVYLGNMATQQTTDEVELARLLTQIHPWAAQARFTRGGGEAMAVAVRIARAATGRTKLVVCGYHGWHDWYLAGNLSTDSPASTFTSSAPDHSAAASDSDTSTSKVRSGPVGSPLDSHLLPGLEPNGVPRQLAGTVVTFRYNRLDEFETALSACGDDTAAIVMEPTRDIDPQPGFLEMIRRRADELRVPLIFDEISSGWRLCPGGAHLLFGVHPDIAVFAKAMSNGFAMGAVIGRTEVMQACHESFISSTYWTEGIGPAAAVASIRKMLRIDVPAHLVRLGTRVMNGWQTAAERHGLSVTISGRPASCRLSFRHPQNDELLTLFTTRMLQQGFLAAGSCSLTLAHQDHHIGRYLKALELVFADLAGAVKDGNVSQHLAGPVKHSGFHRLTD
ncbi:MAG: aminotransferase class III-fold pyridoxal phosphate-dependent enzyme [Planctomycetaceae bacterium]|nr:aminotransferase class III-fold pyridoxal phosphate-dependent enzyme [Planctomycetaceae bacterium]